MAKEISTLNEDTQEPCQVSSEVDINEKEVFLATGELTRSPIKKRIAIKVGGIKIAQLQDILDLLREWKKRKKKNGTEEWQNWKKF